MESFARVRYSSVRPAARKGRAPRPKSLFQTYRFSSIVAIKTMFLVFAFAMSIASR